MNFILDFGKHDYTGNGIKDNLVEVEVLLEDYGGGERLSICGTIWNRLKTDCISAGQNLDTIRKLVGFSPLMKRVHHVWELYHRNDMKAGSPRQEAFLAGYKQAHRDSTSGANWIGCYDTRKDLLERAGLQPDHTHNNYSYGSGWLTLTIPEEIFAEIETWSATSARSWGEQQ
jgi:hypothetical protein